MGIGTSVSVPNACHIMGKNDELRANVRRIRTLVTKKISRIKSNTGALVSGTSVDPRRSAKAISTMTASELSSYQENLQGFLSRKVQFVAGSRGAPIDRNRWQEYKRLEESANNRNQKLFNELKGTKLPNGMTIEAWQAMKAATHPQMTNPSVNTPKPLDRKPTQIERESSLDKMIENMRKRDNDAYFKEQVAAGRQQWNQMVDLIDTVRQEAEQPPTQRDRVNALSDEQFAALLFYTEFMNDASLNYEYMMKMFGKSERAHIKTAADRAMEDYDRLIAWAEKLSIKFDLSPEDGS